MKYCEKFEDLIGKTPLFRLKNYEKKRGIDAKIFGKLEFLNPAGSIKDRVAYSIIKTAEEEKKIDPEYTIIEPTSGNTGIGLAAICAAKKYKLVLTMPETMSEERVKLLKSYGAKVILTDGKKGMKGAIEKAKELVKTTKKSFMPNQFENKANPKIHKLTTGPEIYDQTMGKINILIVGVGTGGTLTGTAEYLKSKKDILVIAVEPESSPVLSKKKSGPHKIVPKNLDVKLIDEVITITDKEAYKTTNIIAKEEGLLLGISSGAAIFAAEIIAKRKENLKKTIVTILPDGGERYISTNVFQNN